MRKPRVRDHSKYSGRKGMSFNCAYLLCSQHTIAIFMNVVLNYATPLLSLWLFINGKYDCKTNEVSLFTFIHIDSNDEITFV